MASQESPGSSTMLSIEQSELERLQTQLIDLRTTNYQLKEEQSKSNNEVTRLQEMVQSMTRDLEKANKTIQRSKKAKEFSALVEENDSLQQKLEHQEDDFRLQNKTIMGELSKVCDENENLKAELKKCGSGSGGGVAGGGVGAEELTHLKAQNTALQKSLQALQDKLKQSTSDKSGDQEETDVGTTNSDKVLDLEVRLATEEEEKRLLQKKLEQLQENARKEKAELQSELEKWAEKAKKKQDSFVQLQEEKEKQFSESRASFDEMVRSKDHHIKTLKDQLHEVRRTLEARGEVKVASEEIARQLATLSTEKEELNLRCTALMEDKEALVHDKDGLKSLLDELGRELRQTKADLGEEQKGTDDLRAQLEEAKLSQETLADQVVKTSEEKHNLIKELEAAQKLAEKRKIILNEMSIKEQETVTEQKKKMDDFHDKYKEEISKLEQQLQQEQSRMWKLSEANEELPELKKKVTRLEEELQVSESRVKELESTLDQEREEHESRMNEVVAQHEESTTALQSELESCQRKLKECRGRMEELESAVEDKEAAVRVVEKKSQSLLKDLKRQLQQMQKREDRLQEQLAALRGSQGLDQAFSLPTPPAREISQDSISKHSRESSLSSLRGLMRGSESSTNDVLSPGVSTPGASGAPPSGLQLTTPGQSSAMNHETQELVERVAELQQQKWSLEERVNHLENTGSALAEDVIQKSEIIKSYFMETKADHNPPPKRSSMSTMVDRMSPMKLMPWSKSKEETLSEINRKMQRALEEALMKNIHLQQNIEMLSMELEKSKPTEQTGGEDISQPEEASN